MAIRKIQTYNAPCLYQKCRPVEKFDRKLATLLDDLAQTMYDAEGVGLAAPQIGILRRAVVIDCGEELLELINPEVVSASGMQGCFEACLSFPGEKGYVERPDKVLIRAYDRSGALCEYEGEGIIARAMLHEIDHLDGLVYKRLVTEPPEGYIEEDEPEETEHNGEAEEAAGEAMARAASK